MKRKKWSILYNALQHYFKEDNTAYASHMTLSCLLALFPFLSFAASLASFLGAAKYAQKSAAVQKFRLFQNDMTHLVFRLIASAAWYALIRVEYHIFQLNILKQSSCQHH